MASLEITNKKRKEKQDTFNKDENTKDRNKRAKQTKAKTNTHIKNQGTEPDSSPTSLAPRTADRTLKEPRKAHRSRARHESEDATRTCMAESQAGQDAGARPVT